MKLKEAMDLKVGDKVWWSDPDVGECSRLIILQGIQVGEMDDHAEIIDQNGGDICCPLSELKRWEG